MTDQKLIAGIFNDFLGLYTGKIQTGIRPLIEKYKNHPMLMGLLLSIKNIVAGIWKMLIGRN